MAILRGLMALNIDDCRKHRKNQGKLQNHPRRIGICELLHRNNILFFEKSKKLKHFCILLFTFGKNYDIMIHNTSERG